LKPGDEHELLDRLKRGEQQAQREFWDRWHDLVYRRALVEARKRDPHDAEDISQEVFVRAFRSIKSFDGRSSLTVWLVRLCQRAAADHYRRARYRYETTDSEQVLMVSEAAVAYAATTDDPAPLKACLDQERRDLFRDALAKLSEEQRTVVEHRIIEGLSVAETAEVMEKSEGAVKMALFRALQRIASFKQLIEVGTATRTKEVVSRG
jgi:RNA polymerase sigma-70 factor (ECF subfamily)